MMSFRSLVSAAAALALAASAAAAAEPTAESRRLAAALPIADMHMHLYRGLTPVEAKARMDRNNVRWGGAVGPVMPGIDPRPFIDLLGERYIPMAGQPEFHYLYSSGGAAALGNAQHPAFVQMIAAADELLRTRKIRGFGELIVNNKSSNPTPSFRRKAATDSQTMHGIFEAAARRGGVLQIHTEDDADSLAGLEVLMNTHPSVPVILSHCLVVTLDTRAPERMLKTYRQVYCDLSARSDSAKGRKDRRIFGPDQVEPAWLQLIESYPDQFLLGSDATGPDIDYDKVIADARLGLLPRLSRETAAKVAYQNARKLFGLTP